MAQSYSCLLFHAVWSTRGREPLIAKEWRDDLYAYAGGIARNQGQRLLAAGGVADHIHLLLSLGRCDAIADVVRAIKSCTTQWVHDNHSRAGPFGWQAGYAAFTVSLSQRVNVESYIARQEQHHANQTFEQEFLNLLDKHQVPYNPKYLWD